MHEIPRLIGLIHPFTSEITPHFTLNHNKIVEAVPSYRMLMKSGIYWEMQLGPKNGVVHKLSPFNVCKTTGMVSHYKSSTKMQWLTSKNAETIRYIILLATY